MDFEAKVKELFDGMAKPPTSLGLLEEHLKKVILAWGRMEDDIKAYHVIFAADNGIVAEGVANYPNDITRLQAGNMVNGRATISSFCNYNHIPYVLVDVGIDSAEPIGINHKVARGTKNFLQEEAMSEAEYTKAFQAGQEVVADLIVNQGCNLLSFGEMGIGNTTTSSAVLHALTGIAPEFLIGHGAAGLHHSDVIRTKRTIIAKGVKLHHNKLTSVAAIMRCVGGFDIVAMCSGMLECTKQKKPFVIDGFIAAVAYACAVRVNDNAKMYGIPSHLSKEPGMAYALLCGSIPPEEVVIHANMALGEGTGAVLMIAMLKTIFYAVCHTARLSEFSGDLPKAEATISV